jgi:hypothetical protein
LLALFLNPEDGGDMLLRKVGWLSTAYTVIYTRRQCSLNLLLVSFCLIMYKKYL